MANDEIRVLFGADCVEFSGPGRDEWIRTEEQLFNLEDWV